MTATEINPIDVDPYDHEESQGENWRLILGDSCEEMPKLAGESVDLSIHSPPFDSLFTYSPSVRDMGNAASREEFFDHYGFVIRELLRVTKPGRTACVHVMDLSTTKASHGVTGLTDFSGEVIQAYKDAGWVYVARITIRKNPQQAAQRTKAQGLAFAQLHRDRAMTRPVHPDYLLLFRKPGENAVPITSPITGDGVRADNDVWISWAEALWDTGSWDDIRESNTLNVRVAREDADERHICPLQLDLVERCVKLWSNKGETVFSPCAGIGSEGFESLRHGRKFLGVELKRSYWTTAVNNLKAAAREAAEPSLFDDDEDEEIVP